MLILGRREGEAVWVDGQIRVVILGCDRRGVKLGIEAPAESRILREELISGVAAENRRASAKHASTWAKRVPLRQVPPGEAQFPADQILSRITTRAPDPEGRSTRTSPP